MVSISLYSRVATYIKFFVTFYTEKTDYDCFRKLFSSNKIYVKHGGSLSLMPYTNVYDKFLAKSFSYTEVYDLLVNKGK